VGEVGLEGGHHVHPGTKPPSQGEGFRGRTPSWYKAVLKKDEGGSLHPVPCWCPIKAGSGKPV